MPHALRAGRAGRLLVSVLMLASCAAVAFAGGETGNGKTAGGDTGNGAAARVGAAMVAGQAGDYSVEMHVTSDGKTAVMKRTMSGGNLRLDMSAEGHQFTMIQLADPKHTMYTLVPEQKMVIKQSMAAVEGQMKQALEKAPAEKPATAPEGKLESLGRETLNGRAADKYRATYAEGAGTIWIDAEKNLPLRMEADGARVDFENYQFGAQPASLFAPPAGWEVKDMDAMMASMPKGMGVGGLARGMAGGAAGNFAGGMAGSFGASLGGSFGAALGGPIGAMAGQFLGNKIGQAIGHKAAHAITGP